MSELLNNSLFDRLEEAILNNDIELVKEIESQIISGKDYSLDKDMILSIIKKEPGRVIKNIINSDDFDVISSMKACSSLLTHNIIEAQITGRSIEDYPVKELYVILGKFINDGLEDGKNEFKKFVTERYKKFI